MSRFPKTKSQAWYKFQPLKLILFGKKYPELFLLTEDQVRERITRIMQSEDGRVLTMYIAEAIDTLQEYADDPSTIQNPNVAAHANGGVYALRNLVRRLDAVAAYVQHKQRADEERLKKQQK
jgi:hypothetical protein